MGNKESSRKEQIFIKTDKQTYYSGETVTGNIFLNLLEQCTGPGIFLVINGYESVHWQPKNVNTRDYTSIAKRNSNLSYDMNDQTIHNNLNVTQEGNLKTSLMTSNRLLNQQQGQDSQDQEIYGEVLFYNHRIPVFQWENDVIPKGQYNFPFSFLLDQKLPTSFEDKGKEYEALIQYKLSGEFEYHSKVGGKPDSTEKITYDQNLLVRHSEKENSQNLNLSYEIHISTSTFFCLNQGITKIQCRLAQAYYSPGDEAKLLMEIDNSECNVGIRRIQVKVMKSLRLNNYEQFEYTIEEVILRKIFDGIGPREKVTGNKKIEHGFNLKGDKGTKVMPSTDGILIKCTFLIIVTIEMDGCICCQTPTQTEIPLKIYPREFQLDKVDVEKVRPKDWNPQNMGGQQYMITSYIDTEANNRQSLIQFSAQEGGLYSQVNKNLSYLDYSGTMEMQ